MNPKLDVDSILAIHRESGGYIGFGRKPREPKFDKRGMPRLYENLFSIRADNLRSMFPALVEWLLEDSYFTVNAYYAAAPWHNRNTGLPDVRRKEKHLSKLTSCYADIDCGRPGSEEPGGQLSWRRAQHEAEYLMDKNIIPHASIMARSGRGVYLFWFLQDGKDPEKLQHAWPEKVQLYKAINRALDERLRSHELPADLRAIDAARVVRVPGSIHTGAKRRVTYVIELDQHGKGFVYTLRELAEFLKLPVVDVDLPDNTRTLARPVMYRRTKNPGSVPLRSCGIGKLNALRAQDLLTIAQGRGGILKRGKKYPDGHISPGRRFTLALLASFMRGSGAPQEDVQRTLEGIAASMKPAYPSDPPDQDPPIDELVEAEYSTRKCRRWSNEKLCALLGVTTELAQEWNLLTIVPKEVTIERDRNRPTRREIAAQATEYIRHYMDENGGWLTCRRAASILTENGYRCGRETARKYLQTIMPGSEFGKYITRRE